MTKNELTGRTAFSKWAIAAGLVLLQATSAGCGTEPLGAPSSDAATDADDSVQDPPVRRVNCYTGTTIPGAPSGFIGCPRGADAGATTEPSNQPPPRPER